MPNDDGPLRIDPSGGVVGGYDGGSGEGKHRLSKYAKKRAGSSDNESWGQFAAKAAMKTVLGSLKRGGKIRKTGAYRLHAGERVLNAKQAKRYRAKRSSKR